MDQNNRNDKNNNNKNNRFRGIVSLVIWALAITMVFGLGRGWLGLTGNQGLTENIDYSVFHEMLAQGQVERVALDASEGLLYITPKDGYVYTDEGGVSYVKSTTDKGRAVFTAQKAGAQPIELRLFTKQMESYDTLVSELVAAGVPEYNVTYVPQLSPLLTFIANFILPFLLLILAFSVIAMVKVEYGKTVTGAEIRHCNTVEDLFNTIANK